MSDEPEIPLEEIQKDKKVRGSLPFPLFLEVMFIFSHEPRKNPYDIPLYRLLYRDPYNGL